MMLESAQLGLFLVAALALNITPGPDMLFTAANGMRQGARAGMISAAGISCGGVVHSTLAAIGVSAVVAASDMAFDILRFAGAAYLVWIGLRSLRADDTFLMSRGSKGTGLVRLFRQGMLTNIFNPKVALFFIAFLPQFTNPETGSMAVQIFFLGFLFSLTGIFINGAVGIFAGRAGQVLLQRPGAAKWIARLSGTMLAGLGIRLLFLEKS
ncbi:LysE family translocator [Sneathiella chinensis]|uniref:Threonine transporter RhtB n=1 Tax=Sneathiella chinensis TaxID=349750 RepID=A0ABQ5U171_9PROT|nr:LysE family translocator [Sneathiella chinensis]GLQ05573.1 threonine transporter RhtB [Sneathiella chinensis]